MATKKHSADEIHALTLEECSRLKHEYGAALHAVQGQRAAWFAAHKRGTLAPPSSDIERAVVERAKALANGHAVALVAQSGINADETPLIVEQAALERLLRALDRSELPLIAEAAVRWAQDRREVDLDLDRECLLAWLRVIALERRRGARYNAAGALGPYLPALHALCRWYSLPLADLPLNLEVDPLREATRAALEVGIITASDIRKAQE